MERSKVGGVALLVLVVASLVGQPVAGSQSTGLATQTSVDPDLVNLNVAIHEDGSATWQVEYFVRLGSDNETAAFEDLMADIEANRTEYLDRFSNRMNATVAGASNATGREMSTENFAVNAEIRTLGNQYGVITYSFDWIGFAVVDGSTITAGDALEGLFLDRETSLQFNVPDGYEVATVRPEPTSVRDSSVVWEGQLDFAQDEPSITLQPTSAGTTPSTTTPAEQPTTPSDESGSILGWVLGGLVVLALLVAGIWYWQSSGGPPIETGAGDDDEGTAPSTELLSNEERVEQFLESQGGRAKQQEIVEGLDWTEAKTSQVLSDMQESGRIDKFRIGRENVVKLPDVDVEND